MKTVVAGLFALLLTAPAQSADRVRNANDFLIRMMGGDRIELLGHTGDTWSRCSVALEVDELGTHASFYYVYNEGLDTERGFFEIVAGTQLKAFQTSKKLGGKSVVEVQNTYTNRDGKKEKFLQRMEFVQNADGSLYSAGVGSDLAVWAPVAASVCILD